MRRPVGVNWVLLFFGWSRFSSPAEVATVATLPSALFDERFFIRSVQVGCSRFSRCCHLIIDLDFHPYDGSRARPLTQSSELGVWAFVFPSLEDFDFMLPPASLPGDCCATVRTLLRSPTNDAAIPRAFAPSHTAQGAALAADKTGRGPAARLTQTGQVTC